MSQAIKLITDSGVILDLNKGQTIELNMGGISLLNLDIRSISYTNSFTLPKTATNEKQLKYCSAVNNNNIEDININILDGLYSKKAVLSVLDVDKDYSCSIKYTGLVDEFKTLLLHNLFDDYVGKIFYTHSNNSVSGMIQYLYNSGYIVPLNTYHSPSYTIKFNDGPFFISISKIIDIVCEKYGYKKVISDSLDFDNDYVLVSNMVIKLWLTAILTVNLEPFYLPYEETLLVSDVLKAVCKTYLADFIIDDSEKTITFKKLDDILDNTPLTLPYKYDYTKRFDKPYSYTNRVNYTVASGIDATFAGDYFLSNGTGEKVAVNIGAYVPLSYSWNSRSLYDVLSTDSRNKVIIGRRSSSHSKTVSYTYYNINNPVTTSGTFTVYDMVIVDIQDVYRLSLNNILDVPKIFEISTYMNYKDADYIIKNRLVKSISLQGLYFVETMAYNIETGSCKLKLIKLKQ